MIYTVTFNPSLDYVMRVNCLNIGETNRAESELITFGGKGINVSLVLSEFGVESTALGFVGGFTGEKLERMLQGGNIKTDFIHVMNGDTRINVKLIDNRMTEINAGGPNVSDEEVFMLFSKIDDIEDGDTLVLAGSVPKNLTNDIYERIFDRIVGRNVKTVVDATGKLLLNTLKFKPFMIKPNVDELGELFGVKITSEGDVVKYARRLKSMGAQNVLVSMGKDGALLVNENGEVLRQKAVGGKPVNSVGAGDSMVAGFIAGSEKDYKTALAYGVAAGGATACSQGLATKGIIDSLICETDLYK
jgi:1-phosphofructokinase